MARRRQREKHRTPKLVVKVSSGPKKPKPKEEPAVNEDKPPALINAEAEQQTVQVKLNDVTQVEHVCPGCRVTIKVLASDQVAAALRGRRPVVVQCGACGQPMQLEYQGGSRIILAGGL